MEVWKWRVEQWCSEFLVLLDLLDLVSPLFLVLVTLTTSFLRCSLDIRYWLYRPCGWRIARVTGDTINMNNWRL